MVQYMLHWKSNMCSTNAYVANLLDWTSKQHYRKMCSLGMTLASQCQACCLKVVNQLPWHTQNYMKLTKLRPVQKAEAFLI